MKTLFKNAVNFVNFFVKFKLNSHFLNAKNSQIFLNKKQNFHGFRATFRTICSQHKAELLTLDISKEVIESTLAHKKTNQVKFSYEREKATLEQKRVLLQWYEDYLNGVEDLGI